MQAPARGRLAPAGRIVPMSFGRASRPERGANGLQLRWSRICRCRPLRGLRMTSPLSSLASASVATLGYVASRHAHPLAPDSRRDQATPVVPAKAGTQAGGLSLCLDPGLRRGDRTTRGHESEANRARPRTEEATVSYARDRSLTIIAICSQPFRTTIRWRGSSNQARSSRMTS